MRQPRPICRSLLRHCAAKAFDFERASAGKSRAARIAIMAMTTNNSMRVNAVEILAGRASGRSSPVIPRGEHSAGLRCIILVEVTERGWAAFLRPTR